MTSKSGTRNIAEGDIILAPILQADGQLKSRPTLVLRIMPPFNDYLVCGFSTWLGFLTIVARNTIVGAVEFVSAERHERLLRRLSLYLVEYLRPGL